ncbi:MAG: zinc ribbon domain-containing protein [Deltaproteobacteria bacterium]|nr:MAG: zinc ribbon domain-containing protein [Deltaproteobacteria bacterium]
MPIYEFKCNKCENVFEQLVFPSDGDIKPPCPSCGENDTCRQMSSFSCGSSDKSLSSGFSSGCASPSSGFS